tara:strand:- start:3900 stop:4574 length:675 start_codon:yes stop_codon:yes gene_type:complete
MENIAFCIPSTTNNRDWTCIQETYLLKILFESLKNIKTNHSIKLFIGYDEDDKLYSKEQIKEYNGHEVEFIKFDNSYKGNPCGIWNELSKIAINQKYEYIFICGDDIKLSSCHWLDIFIHSLKLRNNIGFSAGWSNNNNIPTQFLIHKTHLDIFGFVFPPLIKNYFCDDWMYEIYPEKFRYWNKEIYLLNLGGIPRYTPENAKLLYKKLVTRHKKDLKKYLNSN